MTDSTRVADLYDRWSATYDAMANRTRDLAARVLREAGPEVRIALSWRSAAARD